MKGYQISQKCKDLRATLPRKKRKKHFVRYLVPFLEAIVYFQMALEYTQSDTN